MRWLALAALLIASPAVAAESIGGIAFDTGPFLCNGLGVVQTWTNTYDFAFRIHRMRIVHGRDYGTKADYYTNVIRDDGSWMALFSQDAYDESGSRTMDTGYDGNYQSLEPGQSMNLYSVCTQFGGSTGRGHTIVYIQFTKGDR